jgi:acetyl-CoA C-acetyltransferase
MPEAVIVSAARTPIGKFLGGLSSLRAPELGARAIEAAVERAGISADQVEEVIMGNVIQAGLGQNPARQAALYAGIPETAGAFTVNKVCGSGLKSVICAAQAIRCGDADIIVAGGQENMSQAPYLIPQARTGARLGHADLLDSMVNDGLWDIHNDFHMGMTAEAVHEKYNVPREDMDAFAAESQRKAGDAQASGKFDNEIVGVSVKQRKGDPIIVDADEGPRPETTAESLAGLRPAFKRDGGTVTPGNASTINDGGAALVVMSDTKAAELGLTPLARITGYATGGVAPKWVMMSPVAAIENLEKKCALSRGDFDLIELNEAFAVQAVAVTRELGLDPEKINVHGGAVALGHPIGCSGARILVTLIHALRDRGLKTGLASLCMGGGNGLALSVECV